MQKKTFKPLPSDIAEEHAHLGHQLDYLHGLVAARVFHHMAATIHGEEMSFSQLNTIYRLYQKRQMTIAEIAKGADLSHNAASRMVDRLVRSGLATRRENPDDRRQKMVALSEAGLNLLRDMQQVTIEAYARLFADIPEAVLHRFSQSLDEICANFPKHPMQGISSARSVANTVCQTSDKRKNQDEQT